MDQEDIEVSDKSADRSAKRAGESSVTTLAAEMRQSIIKLAGQREWSDNRKSWLSAAARAAGITLRQARALFQMESENPSGKIVWKVQRAIRELEHKNEEAARVQYRDLSERIARIETIVTSLSADPNHHSTLSDVVLGLLHAARGAPSVGGKEDSAVDRE